MTQERETKRRDRITTEQLTFFINYCKERPQFLSRKNTSLTPSMVQTHWREISDTLNTLRGPTRSTERWKESLNHWKNQLRSHARKVAAERQRTGGGPYFRGITKFEEEAVKVFGIESVNSLKSEEQSDSVETKKRKTIPTNMDNSLKYKPYTITENNGKIYKIKKWTILEDLQVLDCIHKNGNFEKPTVEIYYTKILTETKIDAPWLLLKYKMNGFKRSFIKANTWRRSTEAGIWEDKNGVNCVKERVRDICPYYERLLDIFGDISDDTGDIPISSSQQQEEEEQSDLNRDESDTNHSKEFENFIKITNDPLYSIKLEPEEEEIETIDEQPFSPEMRTTAPTQQRKEEQTLTDNNKKNLEPTKSAMNDLNRMLEIETLHQTKLEQQKKEFSKQMEFEMEKLAFKKEKFKARHDLELEKLRLKKQKMQHKNHCWKMEMKQRERLAKEEMEQKERFAKAEMEQKERLAKYEFDLKYNIEELT